MNRPEGKKRICDALCILGADRPLSKVKISRLIKKAEVSRNTFYYHFEDLQSVLDFMMNDFLDNYLGALYIPKGEVSQALTAKSRLELEQKVCSYISENKEYVYFFLNTYNYRAFSKRFAAKYHAFCEKHNIIHVFHSGKIMPLKRGIFYDYYLHMLSMRHFGILECWAERKFSETAEDFVEIFDTLDTSWIILEGKE